MTDNKNKLSKGATYATITERELDTHVSAIIVQRNCNIRYRGVRSCLDAEGIKVPYPHVKQALLRIDQTAVAPRVGNTVHQRTCNVAGSNSLMVITMLYSRHQIEASVNNGKGI